VKIQAIRLSIAALAITTFSAGFFGTVKVTENLDGQTSLVATIGDAADASDASKFYNLIKTNGGKIMGKVNFWYNVVDITATCLQDRDWCKRFPHKYARIGKSTVLSDVNLPCTPGYEWRSANAFARKYNLEVQYWDNLTQTWMFYIK
jgi:hypothetical protein